MSESLLNKKRKDGLLFEEIFMGENSKTISMKWTKAECVLKSFK